MRIGVPQRNTWKFIRKMNTMLCTSEGGFEILPNFYRTLEVMLHERLEQIRTIGIG